MTQTNGKLYHAHGLEELILLKWPYYQRQCTDSMQFLLKCFTELEQKFFKFVWKHNRAWIAKTISRKQNKAGDIMLLDFILYYKTTVIKNSMELAKKHLDQWNRIEHPEINSYSHDRGGKNKQ